MRNKLCVFILCIIIAPHISVAQYSFTISTYTTGNCNAYGVDVGSAWRTLSSRIPDGGYIGPFNSKGECESTRQVFLSIPDIYNTNTYAYSNCRIHISATPCTGSGGGVSGSINITGPDQGTSFYTPSSLDEILNWDKDSEQKKMALNSDYEAFSIPKQVSTGDDGYDKVRNDATESGWYLDIDKPFRSLNVDETGGINTHSDDYKTLNVDSIVLNKVEFETKQPDDSLLRDWGYVAKDITSFLVSLYCQYKNIGTIGEIKTAALLETNINLYSELYKAKKAIDNGEKYDAPNNFITDAFVFWLGDEYKITGNVFYNTLSKSVKPFVDILVGAAADKIVERLGEDMADKYTKYNNMKTIFSIASDVVDKNLIERTYDHFKQ